ncbi:MAG: hypothetical protein RL016_285 [Actinomycetota bacterium]|jgi:hypothetical protein
MKKAFWLLTGIAAGLVIAKQLDENPRAQAVVDDAAKRAKDFGAAIAEGFREREAELAAPVSAKPAAAKAATTKKPAAKKAVAAKKPAAKTATAKKPATRKPAATKSATSATK